MKAKIFLLLGLFFIQVILFAYAHIITHSTLQFGSYACCVAIIITIFLQIFMEEK